MCAVIFDEDAYGNRVAICSRTRERIVMENQYGYYCSHKCGLDEAKFLHAMSGQSPDWVSPKKQQKAAQVSHKTGSNFDQFMAEYREFIANAYLEIKGNG